MTPRRRLTDRQRAEQVQAVAQRRVDRLTEQHTKVHDEVIRLAADLEAAKARLAWVASDPALKGGTTTVTETGTTEGKA